MVTAHLNNLAIALEFSISDNAGIAAAYDYQAHQLIRKLSHRMGANADYIDILPAVSSDIRNLVARDFEAHAEPTRKEKGKTTKETNQKPFQQGRM